MLTIEPLQNYYDIIRQVSLTHPNTEKSPYFYSFEFQTIEIGYNKSCYHHTISATDLLATIALAMSFQVVIKYIEYSNKLRNKSKIL